jgi:hypothetical protein
LIFHSIEPVFFDVNYLQYTESEGVTMSFEQFFSPERSVIQEGPSVPEEDRYKDPITQEEVWLYKYVHLLFSLFVVWPVTIGAVILLAGIIVGLAGSGLAGIIVLSLGTFLEIVGLVLFGFSEIVPRDVVVALHFMGRVTYLTNCRMLYIPGLMRKIVLPGTQKTFSTDRTMEEGNNPLIVQLKQGVGLPSSEEEEEGEAREASDEQIVQIVVVFRLKVFTAPDAVYRAFGEEFAEIDGESNLSSREVAQQKFGVVGGQIAAVLSATADAVLQKYNVEQFLTEVGTVNAALNAALNTDSNADPEGEYGNPLREALETIGVRIDTIAVADTQDVRDGGYIALRSEAVRAELAATKRRRVAAADQTARISEADANLAATTQELAVQKDIFLQQQPVLDEQIVVDQKAALAALQPLIEELKALPPEQAIPMLLRKLEGMKLDTATAKAISAAALAAPVAAQAVETIMGRGDQTAAV